MKTIGQYQLHSIIAEGGMGVVHLAEHLENHQQVALKILKYLTPESAQRFYREIQVISSLDHPNIIKILDFGVENRSPYMVMPLLTGKNLKERLDQEKTLPQEEALALVQALALALDYAHQQDIIHRDIKAANILFWQDQPILTDFGIAYVSDSTLTQTGEILGSPAYMAPEQFLRDQKAQRVMDIYSLGVILFETLSGKRPFEGATRFELIYNITKADPPSLLDLRSDATPDLDRLCQKCLAKNPEDRYQTARELAEEIERYKQGLPLENPLPDSPSGKNPTFAQSQKRAIKKVLPQQHTPSFSRSFYKTILLILLATLGGSWLYFKSPPEKKPWKTKKQDSRKEEQQAWSKILQDKNYRENPGALLEEILRKKTPHTTSILLERLSKAPIAESLLLIQILGELKDNTGKWQGKTTTEHLWGRLKQLRPFKQAREAEALQKALGNFPAFSSLPKTFSLWEKGHFYYREGQWLKGLQAFQQVTTQKPDWREALLEEARGWVYLKELDRAEKLLKALKKELEKTLSFQIIRGHLILERGSQKEIPEAFQKLKKEKEPFGGELPFLMALYNWKILHDKRKALTCLEKAVALCPRRSDIMTTKLSLLLNMGKNHQCIEGATEALREYGERSDFYYNRGRAYKALLNYEEAQRDLEKALDLLRQQEAKTPEKLQETEKKLALLWALNRRSQIIDLCSEKITPSLNPERRLYYLLNRGRAYLESRQLSPAKTDLEKILSLTEKIQSRSRIGRNYYKAAHYYLGRCSYYLGHFEASRNHFQQSIRAGYYPDRLARFWIGLTYWHEGNQKRAIDFYEKLLKDYPQSLDIVRILADFYWKTRNYSAFLKISQGASQKFNHHNEGYIMEIKNLLLQKQHDSLVALCSRAIQRYPNEYPFYYYRGIAYLQLRDLPRGRADLLYVIAQSPDPKLKKQAQELLKRLR